VSRQPLGHCLAYAGEFGTPAPAPLRPVGPSVRVRSPGRLLAAPAPGFALCFHATYRCPPMTGRERMLKALRFEEPDRPPHFEVMFELEQEAFGLRFPDRRLWCTCSAYEKARMIDACMGIYARIVERFEWDAFAVYWPWSDAGGTTWSIDSMPDWMQFSLDLMEHPERIHAEAERRTAGALQAFDRLADAGADFIHVVKDVAFNAGTFVSPAQFHEIVTPYLARQVAHIRRRGVIPFVHTDGNIMDVLDDYLSLGAACFQSVDPMAGMDIAVVKRRCHGRMALMGNVQCSLLQDGPLAAIRDAAIYCFQHGSPGGGCIFGSSNTVFPGMPLQHYEHMLSVYRGFCGQRGGAA
jgi:uroporphyrinogen decarboxylase